MTDRLLESGWYDDDPVRPVRAGAAGPGGGPATQHDPLTAEIVRALAAPPPVPDMTGRIMGRLGYMRAAPTVARRRRIRRRVGRGVTCLLAGGIVGAAVYVHEVGPSARRPVGPSLPSAIGRDVDEHQQQFNRAIQTIRDLVPAIAPTRPRLIPETHAPDMTDPVWPESWRLDEDIDRSGVGPVRWL